MTDAPTDSSFTAEQLDDAVDRVLAVVDRSEEAQFVSKLVLAMAFCHHAIEYQSSPEEAHQLVDIAWKAVLESMYD